MYQEYYGFTEHPFNVTPDPKFFYESQDHRDALAYLQYGVQERKGILVLSGEVGVGKTIVVRSFLRQMSDQVETALLLSSTLPFTELLMMILEDLGLEARGKSKGELLMDLNAYLLKAGEVGHDVIVVVDEAQNLEPGVLEELRQLSNLETDDEKLLTIVLVGQPELEIMLAAHELRQLRQRIPGICTIGRLTTVEQRAYVRHRLQVVTPDQTRAAFSDGAMEWVDRFAGGIPRLVNIVCDRALLLGYVEDRPIIGRDLLRMAIDDLEGNGAEPKPRVLIPAQQTS